MMRIHGQMGFQNQKEILLNLKILNRWVFVSQLRFADVDFFQSWGLQYNTIQTRIFL